MSVLEQTIICVIAFDGKKVMKFLLAQCTTEICVEILRVFCAQCAERQTQNWQHSTDTCFCSFKVQQSIGNASLCLDHCKQLPGLNNAMGKLAPHYTSEANCESLFSESGHLAKPHMNRVSNETFERLVIAKHRMSRIYCSPAKVKEEFLWCWKGKLFGKDEDRDDLQFW